MMHKNNSIYPEDILESLVAAVFTVDLKFQITSCNKSVEQLLGLPRKQVLGRCCTDVFQSNLCGKQCPVLRALTLGKSCPSVRGAITDHHSCLIEVFITGTVLRNKDASVIGGVAVLQPPNVAMFDEASMQQAVKDCEMQSIIAALRRNNNNRTAAAQELGIHKSTFFRKIKKMGIHLPHVDGRFRSGSN